MPDPSNSSFIPKKTPAKKSRSSSKKQVYLFTLISYITLFATLLGTGGTYFYYQYIDNQLDASVVELGQAVQIFQEDDMLRVQEFDRRVDQAYGRVNNSVSMVSVLEALEAAVIKTVQFDNLTIDREGDDSFLISASVQTDSFDSTIFQREVFDEYSDAIVEVTFEGIQSSNLATNEDITLGEGSKVQFNASIVMPLSAVPKDPSDNQGIEISGNSSFPFFAPEPESEDGDSEGEEDEEGEVADSEDLNESNDSTN